MTDYIKYTAILPMSISNKLTIVPVLADYGDESFFLEYPGNIADLMNDWRREVDVFKKGRKVWLVDSEDVDHPGEVRTDVYSTMAEIHFIEKMYGPSDVKISLRFDKCKLFVCDKEVVIDSTEEVLEQVSFDFPEEVERIQEILNSDDGSFFLDYLREANIIGDDNFFLRLAEHKLVT